MRRGEIWWADLAAPDGSEPGYRRPVLIVQSDAFNRSCISTVLCAVITSNLKLTVAPGNVELSRSESGLPKESVINVSQVITLDKRFLLRSAGKLSAKVMEQVEKGLRMSLNL